MKVISGSLGRRSSRTVIVAPALSLISLVLPIVNVVVDLMSRRSRSASESYGVQSVWVQTALRRRCHGLYDLRHHT